MNLDKLTGPKFFSIGTKISVLFLAFAIIIIVTLSFIGLEKGEDALKKRTFDHLTSVVILKKNQINEFVNEHLEISENLEKAFHADLVTLLKENFNDIEKNNLLHSKIRKKLSIFTVKHEDFIELFIINTEGKIILSTDEKQEGKIKLDRSYFIYGKDKGYIQNIYYSTTLQEEALTVSLPIKDDKGNVLGVFAGRVNLKAINNLMLERTGLGETGETLLVNKLNFLISEAKYAARDLLVKPIYTQDVKDCLNGNTNVGLFRDYRDESVIVSYSWVSEREVCIIAKIDQKEAFIPINELRNEFLVIASIILIISTFLTFFFARSISKPIQDLSKASEELKKGNFNYKIDIKSKDEIGELAETFDEMRLGLKDRNQLLNSLLKSFKGKFGNIAVILMRRNIQDLVKKNPRIKNIIPKEMERSVNRGENLKR